MREQLEKKETGELYTQLLKADPDIAKNIHKNDRVRIRRALEVCLVTGEKMSILQKTASGPEILKDAGIYYFILNRDRESLYSAIENRVEKMFEKGWIKEVEDLCKKSFRDCLLLKAPIGYPEIIGHLEGKCTLSELKESIKRKTKNYAKRQLTWFRKEKDAVWIDCEGKTPETVASEIISSL